VNRLIRTFLLMVTGTLLAPGLIHATNAGIGCDYSDSPMPNYSPDRKLTPSDHSVRIKDYLYVWAAFGINPKEKAPMMKGDRIVQVDGKDVAGMRFEDATDMIDGPEGTEVKITVEREGVAAPLVLHIIRFVPVISAAQEKDQRS
jgi:membrane-associated protease RseP (regulator of RpoE activity)